MEKEYKQLEMWPELTDPKPDEPMNTAWEVINEACVSGGILTDERCNIVAAAKGSGKIEVTSKTLSCGCVLVRADQEEIIL